MRILKLQSKLLIIDKLRAAGARLLALFEKWEADGAAARRGNDNCLDYAACSKHGSEIEDEEGASPRGWFFF